MWLRLPIQVTNLKQSDFWHTTELMAVQIHFKYQLDTDCLSSSDDVMVPVGWVGEWVRLVREGA